MLLFSKAATKICGRVSSRMAVYLVSATTPTIRIGIGVPGSVPNPTCRPIGSRPAKYRLTKVSLTMAVR